MYVQSITMNEAVFYEWYGFSFVLCYFYNSSVIIWSLCRRDLIRISKNGKLRSMDFALLIHKTTGLLYIFIQLLRIYLHYK